MVVTGTQTSREGVTQLPEEHPQQAEVTMYCCCHHNNADAAERRRSTPKVCTGEVEDLDFSLAIQDNRNRCPGGKNWMLGRP